MFKNMKFRVSSPEQSERLQKVLQRLGYDWAHINYKGAVRFTEQSHVYTDDEGNIYSDLKTDCPLYELQDTAEFIEGHSAVAAEPFKGLETAYDKPTFTGLTNDKPYDPVGRVKAYDAAGNCVNMSGEPLGGNSFTLSWPAPEVGPNETITGYEVFRGYNILDKEVPVRNKYMREIKPDVWVDVYDCLRAFNVTDPCLQHLVKKALAVGQRGHKDANEDYKDIKASAIRALEIYEEWNV